jgi:Fusaric acid resistance protein-like
LVGKARDWIAAHRAEITLSLRITVAGLIALALGELLGVKQVYWAVLTAVIVMQARVGGSLKATIDRLAGTAAGALLGRGARRGDPASGNARDRWPTGGGVASARRVGRVVAELPGPPRSPRLSSS